jgi:gluconate 2-dehydrogenase gamma chain
MANDDVVKDLDMDAAPPKPLRLISRRALLRRGGAVAATTASGAALSACDIAPGAKSESADSQPSTTNAVTSQLPTSIQFPEVPETPAQAPPADVLLFFTPAEARTVDALTARIMPGDANDPGAREAGVVTYIDNFLAIRRGYPEPTYLSPPFAQVYQGDSPPADSGSYQTVWVPAGDVQRYGYQSILSPQDVYRMGVAAVDRYAQSLYGKNFVDLSEDQQDRIVGDMADDRATGFPPDLSGSAFFHNLRRHTAEGMFADPAYGGNRDLVGWKLVGYPGAQRAYNPSEFQVEGTNRQPQSIHQMMPFQPGMATNPGVILPVSGSEEEHRHE